MLLLGYLYFRLAGEAYALVSIGLISFAAVAQFAPAMLGGIYWKGGTRAGALAGLVAGFALWVYTLLLPSLAQVGLAARPASSTNGPFGIALLRPEQLFGLDRARQPHPRAVLEHARERRRSTSACRSGARRRRARPARRCSSSTSSSGPRAPAPRPVFWRGRAQVGDLLRARRPLPRRGARRSAVRRLRARARRRRRRPRSRADARLVQFVETQLAGAIGGASARVMVASVVEEEPLGLDDVMRILDEASQVRAYRHALEEKSQALERATAELRAANEQLKSSTG